MTAELVLGDGLYICLPWETCSQRLAKPSAVCSQRAAAWTRIRALPVTADMAFDLTGEDVAFEGCMFEIVIAVQRQIPYLL